MKQRKLIAFALALCMVTTALAGCNKSDSTTDTDTSGISVSSKETNIDDTISTLDLDFTANDLDVGYDDETAAHIVFEADTATVDGEGAEVTDNDVIITKAGCYVVTGTASDSQIIINAGNDDKIQLVLSESYITCKDGAPIYIKSADKVFITLADGTTNELSDSGSEYAADGDISPDAVIFSKEDLTINGTGTLNINAGYKHGIVSKDDLVIAGGNIEIKSAKTAIEGKDSVKIADGTITIDAGTNGIVSSNSEDSTKGYVYIAGGKFDITAATDGLQAETILTVEDGEFKIVTGGGAAASTKTHSEGFGGGMGGKGGFGRQGDTNNNDNSGDAPQMPQDGEMPRMGEMPQMGDKPQGGFGRRNDQQAAGDNGTAEVTAENVSVSDVLEQTASTDSSSEADAQTTEHTDLDNTSSTSMKGLKAGSAIAIQGGSFDIDAADDTLHTGGSAVINGGSFELSTGDDGIHADEIIEITSGTVNINKSYEGVEAKYINISGGSVKVVAQDDGFNASDGSGENFGGMGGRPGGQQSDSSSSTGSTDSPYLKITGGKVEVNADGDGLDSNGSMLIEGGDITVYGPTNAGNGALDKGDGNYLLTASGGTLAAFGATGMEEGFTEDSTQTAFLHNFSSTIAGGTEVTVKDSSGEVIATYTPAKSWQSMVFTSDKLKEGETYTITAGDMSEEITLEGTITSNSTGGMGGGFGGRGRH
ncbi:MAG: carbohydrate-binding domain-containing protein [Ruminococcus sp.]|nr:carbohydrate-binding domain-containing protein [Ruminococcus sp.]